MTLVTSLILRQMRAPFITVITGYSIAMLGMMIAPGVDAEGKPWHMSIFEAFYFVTYTATTIGFGEIPYPLSNAQRMWAMFTIYTTVVSWFYALGKTISLFQDPSFRAALRHSTFARHVRNINESFILICGFGETGSALTRALDERNMRAVVVENDMEKIQALQLKNYRAYVPGIQGDARDPEQLIQAGLQNSKCRAVIAVTADDSTNLKIAITSKLLNPGISVICRSELKEYEENMYSFGTDYVINPYDTFATIFDMALHSPSLHLLYDWLTGVPDTTLTNPLHMRQGHWVMCGYGRFGEALHRQLLKFKIPVTIIDPSDNNHERFIAKGAPPDNDFIFGTGFDSKTLRMANIENSVGLIAGTDNDSNNLSIIMTARALNPELFVVARQNKNSNEKLFHATRASIVMQPSDIIARRIRSLLTAPLVITFLNKAREQAPDWANIAISRLIGALGDTLPEIWTVNISPDGAHALYASLQHGRVIRVGNLTQDPRAREHRLPGMALMLKRGNKIVLMPTDDIALKMDDQLLFCGTPLVERSMKWTLNDQHSLNYVMTYDDTPDTWLWQKLHRLNKKNERRRRPRAIGHAPNHKNQ